VSCNHLLGVANAEKLEVVAATRRAIMSKMGIESNASKQKARTLLP
jgi:hypothetical protein